MLAFFTGDGRSSAASKSAMHVSWFVTEILGAQFLTYFRNNRKALGQALDFTIGCGIDDGYVFAVRVGIRGSNDVAWVGRCTNIAAKLASRVEPLSTVLITQDVYSRLNKASKYHGATDMWSPPQTMRIGGIDRRVRGSSYWWRP
jgi:class 3 adenylate cyclase